MNQFASTIQGFTLWHASLSKTRARSRNYQPTNLRFALWVLLSCNWHIQARKPMIYEALAREIEDPSNNPRISKNSSKSDSKSLFKFQMSCKIRIQPRMMMQWSFSSRIHKLQCEICEDFFWLWSSSVRLVIREKGERIRRRCVEKS